MTEINPHSLITSLDSLSEICLKKISGIDLIDDTELNRLYPQVQEGLRQYLAENKIVELLFEANSFPFVKTFERNGTMVMKILRVATLYAMPLLICFLLLINPLAGMGMLILWVPGRFAIWFIFYRQRIKLQNDLKRISEIADTAAMMISNHESFKK